ncbi:hypothetical protein AgCh_021532 [Apium graveolens]
MYFGAEASPPASCLWNGNYYTTGSNVATTLSDQHVLNPQLSRQVLREISGCEREVMVFSQNNRRLMDERIQTLSSRFDKSVLIESKFNKFHGFREVLFVLRNGNSLLLMILLGGLVYSSPVTSFPNEGEYAHGQKRGYDSDFMVSASKLQQRIKSAMNELRGKQAAGVFLYEFLRANSTIKEVERELWKKMQLNETVVVDDMNEKVKNLKNCFEVLQSGAENFIVQIDDAD